MPIQRYAGDHVLVYRHGSYHDACVHLRDLHGTQGCTHIACQRCRRRWYERTRAHRYATLNESSQWPELMTYLPSPDTANAFPSHASSWRRLPRPPVVSAPAPAPALAPPPAPHPTTCDPWPTTLPRSRAELLSTGSLMTRVADATPSSPRPRGARRVSLYLTFTCALDAKLRDDNSSGARNRQSCRRMARCGNQIPMQWLTQPQAQALTFRPPPGRRAAAPLGVAWSGSCALPTHGTHPH